MFQAGPGLLWQVLCYSHQKDFPGKRGQRLLSGLYFIGCRDSNRTMIGESSGSWQAGKI
jgi:hypothetical protein